MLDINASVSVLACPICHCRQCSHFVGWTEDGRTLEHATKLTRLGAVAVEEVLPTDTVVKTGVSARVYRA